MLCNVDLQCPSGIVVMCLWMGTVYVELGLGLLC